MNNTESKLRNDLLELEQETTCEDQFRLAQTRNNALSQTSRARKSYFWPALATSFASIILIGVLFNPSQQTEPTTTLSSTNPSSTELLNEYYLFELSADLLDENIDLYEDLDFYDWLAQADS